MSDATGNETLGAETDSSRSAIGEQLREARKKNKLSVDEVAQELHLDVDVVRALEDNERDKLPAQIFVQGYLKSYARLVGLPADVLLQDFNRQAVEPPPLSVISTSSQLPVVRLRSIKLIRNGIIVLLVMLALWLAWPLVEGIIESQRDSGEEQLPGRLELPPVSGVPDNES